MICKKTTRLMHQNGLKLVHRRKYKPKKTKSDLSKLGYSPNIIDQDFKASGPNEKWGCDISQLLIKIISLEQNLNVKSI